MLVGFLSWAVEAPSWAVEVVKGSIIISLNINIILAKPRRPFLGSSWQGWINRNPDFAALLKAALLLQHFSSLLYMRIP